VILSPHLDDAVLSCWHLLTQPGEVTVINVFAGIPDRLAEPAWWDQYTGAMDSGARVRERVEEDRQALALAGRSAANLSLLNEQYRQTEPPLAELPAQIDQLLARDADIYAPAAFANHADHTLVREAALELRANGFAVSLYADLPHATLYGWTAWVTGGHASTSRDLAAVTWERSLAATAIGPQEMSPLVHALDSAARASKLEAVRAYRTQLQGLVELAGRPLTDRKALGYEVEWTLPAVATASRAAADQRAARRR